MKSIYSLVLLVTLAALLTPFSLHAATSSPSFDCSKTNGESEQLVCNDKQLATLDRELARLYTLAVNNPALSKNELKYLKAFQRGWIKGRNEVWKVEEKKGYVRELYLIRISEILQQHPGTQSSTSTEISNGPVFYDCSGEKIEVYFFQIDPPALVLYQKKVAVVMILEPSGSGARYVGEYVDTRVEFWEKGNEAMLTTFEGKEMQCSEKED